MKKKNIMAVVASALLVVWGGFAGAVSLAVGWLIDLLLKRHEPTVDAEPYYEKRSAASIDQAIHLYGDPDDVIVVDVTRANEVDGAILAYTAQQFFVVKGQKIGFRDITDVTFHNVQHVYAMPEYAVVISTSLRDTCRLELPAGSDVTWAGEVVAQIKQYLRSK